MTERERETADRDDFEAGLKRVFDDSVAGLDGATRSRLSQARAAAVAAAARPAGWRQAPGAPRLRLAGGIAAALLAATVLWLPDGSAPGELTAFDDLDILLEEEDLELYEDLEFFAWLDAQAAAEDGADEADGSG